MTNKDVILEIQNIILNSDPKEEKLIGVFSDNLQKGFVYLRFLGKQVELVSQAIELAIIKEKLK